MSEVSVTSTAPISGWDAISRSIVRSLEALNSEQRNYEQRHWSSQHDPLRCDGLVSGLESFLLVQAGNKPCSSALAELAAGFWDCMTPERASRYLFTAASEGYIPAQYEIACRARQGKLYPPRSDPIGESPELPQWELDDFNRLEAARWMNIAAEGGSLDARYNLGMALITSDDSSEFNKGAQWLKLAVLQKPQENSPYDDNWATEKYTLAYLMELGRVDPFADAELLALYETAANGGVPEAMLAAGHYFEHGIGVDRNLDTAIKWYRKAGEDGCDGGHILVSLLSDAEKDIKKAAGAGYVPAMLRLAKLKLEEACACGMSPPFDYERETFEEGLWWYQVASDNGSLEATLILTEIYEDSWHHTPPYAWRCQSSAEDRLESALGYYEQAQNLGWKPAAKNIERVKKLLNCDGEIDRMSDS